MDESTIHELTLDQLHKAKMLMTSPEWSEKMQAANPDQRQKSQLALLRLQQACTAMENAQLDEIADQLKDNEPALLAGQKAIDAACDHVDNIQSVLKTVTSLVNAAAKVVTL